MENWLDPSLLRICVNSAENRSACGKVYGMRLARPEDFSDLGGMLLSVDRLLDGDGFPQAFQRARVFSARPAHSSPENQPGMSAQQVRGARGSVLTCDVIVRTRRSSSWQGEVDWLDGSARQSFDSALQLVRMLDERLAAASQTYNTER